MNAKAGTPAGDLLDVLVTLFKAWERKHFPMDIPDPIEAIRIRMEQLGLTPRDPEPMICRLNRVYEVLNRTRPVMLRMIRKLHKEIVIPMESLIGVIEG